MDDFNGKLRYSPYAGGQVVRYSSIDGSHSYVAGIAADGSRSGARPATKEGVAWVYRWLRLMSKGYFTATTAAMASVGSANRLIRLAKAGREYEYLIYRPQMEEIERWLFELGIFCPGYGDWLETLAHRDNQTDAMHQLATDYPGVRAR